MNKAMKPEVEMKQRGWKEVAKEIRIRTDKATYLYNTF